MNCGIDGRWRKIACIAIWCGKKQDNRDEIYERFELSWELSKRCDSARAERSGRSMIARSRTTRRVKRGTPYGERCSAVLNRSLITQQRDFADEKM